MNDGNDVSYYAFVFGTFVGAVVGLLAGYMICGTSPNSHLYHVKSYNECIKLGAPEQNCFKVYLLDEPAIVTSPLKDKD